MANFKKLWRQAKAGDYSDHNQDPNGRGQRTINQQETWMVLFDGYVATGVQVVTNPDVMAAGLPQLGLVYNGLFCGGLRPTRTAENPFLWRVDVTYATVQQQTNNGSQTLWNLNLGKSTAAREVTRCIDWLGYPLNNTFGDLLPQLPTLTLYEDVFTISWSTSEAPNEEFEDMKGKLNDDDFTFSLCGITRTFTKSQAKCIQADFSTTKVITATNGSTNQFAYVYQATFAMQIRKDGWRWTAPNEGWRGYVDESGTVDLFRDGPDTRAVTNQDTPRTSPTKMDLEGFELPRDVGKNIILLPDGAKGQATPSAGRPYDVDGAFELEERVLFAPLFALLHD